MNVATGRLARALAVALLVGLLPLAGVQAQQLPLFTDLVRENSPAVVNISSTQIRESRGGPELSEDHPFFEFFERFGGRGQPGPRFGQSRGSGFIVSNDGVVLTNYHVVENADEIIVRLSDRREFVAEVLGYDQRSDLAVLRIQADELPVVRVGSSAELEVGEWVLAIGSPFGFEHSVTAGIVSAKQRSLPRENYVPFIQTDVAINPGNSGGPLFNLDGEVVGINSHIYSRTGGFMGLSFAIPIELAMDVADQLRSTGRVARGWLGVVIQDVSRDLAESFSMDRPYGALVADMVVDSPAQAAGFEVGDIIVGFSGQTVHTSSELPPMVGRTRVGSEVEVDVIRRGEPRTILLEIGELPDELMVAGPRQAPPPSTGEAVIGRLGLQLRDLAADELAALDLDGGVIVDAVNEGPAADSGLRRGDVITMLNQRRIRSVDEFLQVLADVQPGTAVPLLVHRGGSPRFFAFRLPATD
jgi:serine protease Do